MLELKELSMVSLLGVDSIAWLAICIGTSHRDCAMNGSVHVMYQIDIFVENLRSRLLRALLQSHATD